jgi:hypothetical protein
MSRRIIAIVFLTASVFISILASYKVQNVCNTAIEKIEKTIELCESDLKAAKTQAEDVYEYWQKSNTILEFFIGKEKTVGVKLSMQEMLFLIKRNNVDDFTKEALSCKRYLIHISEFEKAMLTASLQALQKEINVIICK